MRYFGFLVLVCAFFPITAYADNNKCQSNDSYYGSCNTDNSTNVGAESLANAGAESNSQAAAGASSFSATAQQQGQAQKASAKQFQGQGQVGINDQGQFGYVDSHDSLRFEGDTYEVAAAQAAELPAIECSRGGASGQWAPFGFSLTGSADEVCTAERAQRAHLAAMNAYLVLAQGYKPLLTMISATSASAKGKPIVVADETVRELVLKFNVMAVQEAELAAKEAARMSSLVDSQTHGVRGFLRKLPVISLLVP